MNREILFKAKRKPMPLADFYIKRSEFEVYGNIFDNPDLLEVE